MDFAEQLKQAMSAKSIKHSPIVLMRLFNAEFAGNSETQHTTRNWMLGRSMPTQGKLILLAKLLDISAEYLRFGTKGEKKH